jgi:hypothetical protein
MLRSVGGSCYPSGMNFDQALAAHDLRALSDADVPVDDTGWNYDRFIPSDRVAPDCGLDGTHGDVVWDDRDGVHRCADCDTPVHPPWGDCPF